MSWIIKTPEQINKMRAAGALAARALAYACSLVKPGVSTNYIDLKTDSWIRKKGAIPAALNYGATYQRPPFPKSICTSVNEVICHGIPGKRKLKEGDIVCIDVALFLEGYVGDTAATVPVGKVSKEASALIQHTLTCLRKGIAAARAGTSLVEIGRAIQRHGKANGLGVVEQFVGHGIGSSFHEYPQVSHVESPHAENSIEIDNPTIVPNVTFTIEPMINAGTWEAIILEDGWTAITTDRSLSAQFEHSILINDQGNPEILTLLPGSENDVPGGLNFF